LAETIPPDSGTSNETREGPFRWTKQHFVLPVADAACRFVSILLASPRLGKYCARTQGCPIVKFKAEVLQPK
jgi:hypothetical protein